MTPLQRYIAHQITIHCPFNIKIKIKTNDNNKEHPISNERTNDWSSVSEVPKVNGSCVVQTRKGILSGFLEVERKCLNLCQEKGGRKERGRNCGGGGVHENRHHCNALNAA